MPAVVAAVQFIAVPSALVQKVPPAKLTSVQPQWGKIHVKSGSVSAVVILPGVPEDFSDRGVSEHHLHGPLTSPVGTSGITSHHIFGGGTEWWSGAVGIGVACQRNRVDIHASSHHSIVTPTAGVCQIAARRIGVVAQGGLTFARATVFPVSIWYVGLHCAHQVELFISASHHPPSAIIITVVVQNKLEVCVGHDDQSSTKQSVAECPGSHPSCQTVRSGARTNGCGFEITHC